MEDQVLSIERMQHLKEFGVDTSKSSLFWVKKITNEIGEEIKGEYRLSFSDKVIVRNFEMWDIIPAFTLQDVLDLLPEEIIVNDKSYGLNVIFPNEGAWEISYFFCGECKEFFINTKLIDSAYEMLCWCAENGYIKTNKDK